MANTAGALTSVSALLASSQLYAVAGVDGIFQGSITLDSALTLTKAYPSIIKIDPGGAHRDVTLEAEAGSKGELRWLINAADGAENLVVKDDSSATIVTINQNECAIVYCNGTAWSLVCLWTHALS